jgi:hypothetical protein
MTKKKARVMQMLTARTTKTMKTGMKMRTEQGTGKAQQKRK